jgi:predicted dehydrogenase
MTRVRLAVVGCGLAARNLHLPALQERARKFRLVAACSRTAPKARAFARLAGVPEWTDDWRSLLTRDDIDALLVATPVELNLPIARAALRAGKHLLVEKPLATSMPECRAMVRLANAHPHVVAMLAENFRHRPAFRRIGAELDAGTIGPVAVVQWTTATDVAPETSAYARTAWRLNHVYPGGFVMDAGVHFVHAIRFLFGEIVRVASWAGSANPVIGSTDMHHMEFDTATGVHGVLCQYFSARGIRQDRLTIVGATGTLVLDAGELTLHRRGRAPRRLARRDDGGYRAQLDAFHAAIVAGAPVETSFAEGLRDFRALAASLRSAARGRPVRIVPDAASGLTAGRRRA